MRLRTLPGAPLVIDPELSPPLLYLDYSVIADIAGTDRGAELRNLILRLSGTLCWSWPLTTELISICDGPTYRRIVEYLKSFEHRWVIIDSVPYSVIQREEVFAVGKQNPVLDDEFLRAAVTNWDARSPFDLGTIFAGWETRPDLVASMKASHRDHKKSVCDSFIEARRAYRTQVDVKKRVDNAESRHRPGTPLTRYVLDQLEKECILTNDEFRETDVLDFWHAVVSVSYADVAVFDRKWARRLRERIVLPPEAARVYDGTQIDEVVELLRSSR